MLTSLQELSEYSKTVADRIPIIRNEIWLRSPGCSQGELDQLVNHIPGMPPNYLKCLRLFCLQGVSIRGINLWPGGPTHKWRLIDDIVRMNTASVNPFFDLMRKNGLFEVASDEGNPICVAGKGSSLGEDKTFRLNTIDRPPCIEPLAPNFEKMLLAAGNLSKRRDEFGKELEEGEAEQGILLFQEDLEALGLSGQERATWREIAQVIFS